MRKTRPDQHGAHRTEYDKNRRKILQTQNVCGICGQIVDKSLKYPDPMCAVIDHIVPIDKGGHPSDIGNLQLAHNWCNRQKSDKMFSQAQGRIEAQKHDRIQTSRDWNNFKAD